MKTKLYKNKIEVRKSNIHGWGVFAQRDIYADEIIAEYVGEAVSYALFIFFYM